MFIPEYKFDSCRRLNQSADYAFLFKNGHLFRLAYFKVYAQQSSLRHPRIGIVVGKKIIPRAVDRNRLKRRIRESFRLKQLDLPSIDFVLIFTKKFASDEPLKEELNKLWLKLEFFYKNP